MTQTARRRAARREPLSRERVLRAAVELADEGGIEATSMRRLGQAVGVEAMSLYNHVGNKDDLLDGMAELVLEELLDEAGRAELPDPARDWQGALRARVLIARTVMLRHRWMPALLETRTTLSPAATRWFDEVLGTLRAGGFSYDLGHHALHALGSRALGFTQELFDPGPGGGDEASDELMATLAPQIPHLVGMLSEIAHDDGVDLTLGWCDDQTEFEFGLDVLLDGLERRRASGLPASPRKG